MKPKIIKNEKEYNEALAHIEYLMDLPETPETDEEIELFTALIEQYEEKHFPIELPDPIEAIYFVMDQQNLSRKDLVPILGSQSKVSEVLKRKRALSLSMIRKLHEQLDIPAEILLQDPLAHDIPPRKYDIKAFPFNEMVHNNYFPGYDNVREAKQYHERLLEELFSAFPAETPEVIYCRRGNTGKTANRNALLAWQAHILHTLNGEKLPQFSADALNDDFFNELLEFSQYRRGPLLVEEHLAKQGIHFVIEPHLSETYLDGAAFLAPHGNPAVALTLRHDRADNFWFTLTHELAHCKLHLKTAGRAFFDETDGRLCENEATEEQEANAFAQNMLVPQSAADMLIKHPVITRQHVLEAAESIKRNPAIVAGRLRWERNNYTQFSDMLGNRDIKHLFTA